MQNNKETTGFIQQNPVHPDTQLYMHPKLLASTSNE